MASSENDTECTLDVALVEGAVVSEKDAARLRAIRKRAKTAGGAGHLRGLGRRGSHGPRHRPQGVDRRSLRRGRLELRLHTGPGAARSGEGGSQHHRLPHRKGALPGGHRQPAERRCAGLSRVPGVHGVPHAGKQLHAGGARRAVLRAHYRGRLRGAMPRACASRAWVAAARRPISTRPRWWRHWRKRASTGSAWRRGCVHSLLWRWPDERGCHRTSGPRGRPRRDHGGTGRRHGRERALRRLRRLAAAGTADTRQELRRGGAHRSRASAPSARWRTP